MYNEYIVNNNKNFTENLKKTVAAENLGKPSEKYSQTDPRLLEAAIEIATKTKSVLGGLYFDFRKTETGTLRKLKNKVIGKIANIVRNVVERPFLTQQKYNEQMLYLVQNLLARQAELEEEVASLKSISEKDSNESKTTKSKAK